MKTTYNDYGECITAVGAPGSKVRCELEYPRLLRFMRELQYDDAVLLLESTLLSKLEKSNLLQSYEAPYHDFF